MIYSALRGALALLAAVVTIGGLDPQIQEAQVVSGLDPLDCSKLAFTWGEKGKNDSVVCRSDKRHEAIFNGTHYRVHTEKFACELPDQSWTFTYAQVMVEISCLCTPEFRISQVTYVGHRRMLFEVESHKAFNAHLEVYANKTCSR